MGIAQLRCPRTIWLPPESTKFVKPPLGLLLRLAQEMQAFFTEFAIGLVDIIAMQGETLWLAHRLALMFPLLAHGEERQFCRAAGRRDRDPAQARAREHL